MKDPLTFLQSITTTTDTEHWAKSLRAGLLTLLHDVDYAVITVRATIDLIDPIDDSEHRIQVLRDSLSHTSARTKVSVKISEADRSEWWQLVLQDARNGDFPLNKYREPVGYDYYHQKACCGSIMLFRDKDKPRISDETLQLMEELRGFLSYIITDHIARRQIERPTDTHFRYLVQRIAQDTKLTKRQEQVLMLLLTGFSYEGISDVLHISKSTAQSHVVDVYRKLGCSNKGEVFARYITPKRT